MLTPRVMLDLAVVVVALVLSLGTLYLWRRHAPASRAQPSVRILGANSPILTWLRYPSWPHLPIHLTAQPEGPAPAAPTFFAAETTEAATGPARSAPQSATAADVPPFQDNWEDWWTKAERWVREQLTPAQLRRTWSGVLARPGEATPAVGATVSWRSLTLEWLLIAVVVLSFCGLFLKFDPAVALPGNESQVFQTIGWTLLNGLKAGTFPLWNPYLRTGLPFAGDPMLYVYNPLVSLPTLLFGEIDGFKVALLLSFLAAGWGMWYLGKVLGFGRPARLWVALMFAFSGPAVARFFQGQYLFVFGFAWIPWALAGLLAALRTYRRRHVALAIGALVLIFFSGNVYYAYYMLVLMALLTPVWIVNRTPTWHVDWRRVQVLAVIGVVALGLIAIQLLPLAGLWPRLSKATNLQLTDSQTIRQVVLDFTSPDPNRPDAVPALTREEFYAYIGWWPFIALAFLPLAVWKRERRPILLFGLMVVLVFAWIDVRDMPWRGVYVSVPFLYQFRYPTRMLAYGACALIVLAGLGLDSLWTFAWPAARQLLWPDKSQPPAAWRARLFQAAALGASVVLLGFMLRSVNDVFQTNQPATGPQATYPLAQQIGNWLRANDSSNYFVDDLSDWHQAWISNGLRYLNAWYHFDDLLRADGEINTRPVQARPNYWVLGNDRTVSPDMGADPAALQTLGDYTVYQMPHSLPFAFTVARSALLTTDQPELQRDDVTALAALTTDPNRIAMIAQGSAGQVLVALTIDYPGWRLTVDGHSAPLENVGGYLAAEVQPGIHQYVFSYAPISFYVGLVISLLCLAVTLFWLLSDLPLRVADIGLAVGGAVGGIATSPGWQRLRQRLPSSGTWTLDVFGVRLQVTRANAKPVEWAAVLGGVLFAGSLVVYAITRLWALDRFPIYFFADETANPLFALDLIAHGFRDAAGHWFPLYFDAAAGRWTPLLSVYVHAVSLLIFGKSLFVTRATSAIFSIVAVVSVALIFKLVFKLRFWWIGALLLGLVPAWFLHSRTAFETVIMVSFFAAFLLCYMLYRLRSPNFAYPTLILGAAAFYTYSNGQSLMVAMGVLLMVSDWRYHLQQWRVLARALVLGVVLVLPLALFRLQQPSAFSDHLRAIDSYLTQDISTGQKIQLIVQTYLYALSPQYLFIPNNTDIPRHIMAGYGQMGLVLSPLVLLGLLISLRHWRSSPYRVVVLSALAAPVGAALVGVGITRVLSLVITTSLLAGLGLNAFLEWLSGRLSKWRPAAGIAPVVLSLGTFAVLAWASLGMLNDALTNGPLWYHDYGLYGMQYGAEQLFGEAIPAELAADPHVTVMVSSTWANATDEFVRFFLTPAQQARVQVRDIDYYTYSQQDLSNTLLIMTPNEYQNAQGSGKFKSIQVERVLPYPDGTPGFYFARLTYVDNVAAMFAADEAARNKPVEETIQLAGQTVTVLHSRFGAGQLADIFDGDPFSLIRGEEANPLVIEIHFPAPRTLSGMQLILGAMDSFSVTVIATPPAGNPATLFGQSYQNLPADPHLTIQFTGGAQPVSVLRLEIKNLQSGATAQIHVRDVDLN